jgi:hypothetical protein
MDRILIDADFPGGNIIVDDISDDTVRIHQELRDTTIWWFYWLFRVRNAAGRTIRFEFTNGNVFSPAGPCFSPNGVDWQWLGLDCTDGDSFTYKFGTDQHEAFFAFCPTYIESNLHRFLQDHSYVNSDILTTSEQQRSVELLSIPAANPKMSLLIAARHHACESVANYVLEGILEEWGKDNADSTWLRENVDLYAVPFVDKDGVENGDQGKMRAPHDHWQDYTKTPAYESVRAIRSLCNNLRAPLALAIDLHCPWIRGEHAESILLLEPESKWLQAFNSFWSEVTYEAQCAISKTPMTRVPYGTSFNIDSNDFATYIRRHHNALAFTLEFPYAIAGNVLITPEESRSFGKDIVRGTPRFLKEHSALLGK